jgi:hypothetical protein
MTEGKTVMTAEFLGFYDPDSDRPGLVVLASNAPGDNLADESFWSVVTTQAWEDEWRYDDPRARQFDGRFRHDCADEWAAYVRQVVTPPEWRWYVWRTDPEVGELGQLLHKADEGEPAYEIPGRWVCKSRCRPVPCAELLDMADAYAVDARMGA